MKTFWQDIAKWPLIIIGMMLTGLLYARWRGSPPAEPQVVATDEASEDTKLKEKEHYTAVLINFRGGAFCGLMGPEAADALQVTFNGRQVLRYPFLGGPPEVDTAAISPETVALVKPWAEMWQAIAKDFCKSQGEKTQ